MSDETKDRQARLDALRQQAIDDLTDLDLEDRIEDVAMAAATERVTIHARIVELRRIGNDPEAIARVLWAEFVSPHKYSLEEVVDRVRAEVRQIDQSRPRSRWERFREWFKDWWAEASL